MDEKESLFQYRLVTVTQLAPNRGLEAFLTCCKILDARHVDFEAIIIGEGPDRQKLQETANRYRLNHRVRFSGARRMEEIIEIMGRADLFVLPCPELVRTITNPRPWRCWRPWPWGFR
ncbi:MAG: glycosyltransferase [candidate division KSB1 bacterium]|nr:glycosyltransferase [candidate division KSB1 bacterium]